VQLTLLGVGAMRSPRYAPAGLLLVCCGTRIAFDGGPGAEPRGRLDAWLVTDEHSELRAALHRLARAWGCEAGIAPFVNDDVSVEPHAVAHTSHPTVGYLISSGRRRVAWAPEFWEFPPWAAGVDILFADAAGWRRPIRFRGGVGGHAAAVAVCAAAQAHRVQRLVLAHIGRPTIQAIDRGDHPPFGEFGVEGRVYRLRSET
jgi:hypothetical protein